MRADDASLVGYGAVSTTTHPLMVSKAGQREPSRFNDSKYTEPHDAGQGLKKTPLVDTRDMLLRFWSREATLEQGRPVNVHEVASCQGGERTWCVVLCLEDGQTRTLTSQPVLTETLPRHITRNDRNLWSSSSSVEDDLAAVCAGCTGGEPVIGR